MFRPSSTLLKLVRALTGVSFSCVGLVKHAVSSSLPSFASFILVGLGAEREFFMAFATMLFFSVLGLFG